MAAQTPLRSSPLDNDHLRAIGRVTVEWEYLAYWLRHLIGMLARVNDTTAAILLTHSSVPQLLDALGALSNQATAVLGVTPETTDRLLKLASRIKTLNQQRNGMVHAVWIGAATPDEQHIGFQMKARGELKSNSVITTTKELDELADKMIAEQWEIIRAIAAVGDELFSRQDSSTP